MRREDDEKREQADKKLHRSIKQRRRHRRSGFKPSEMSNIKTMVNTLSHADIVMATQGSISLDAAALDKKIINIAFDGSLTRSYTESVKRWYEMDHYLPVVKSGGVSIVDNFLSLDEAIKTLISKDPQKAGRARLREIELEPFCGDSSARQVQAMLS